MVGTGSCSSLGEAWFSVEQCHECKTSSRGVPVLTLGLEGSAGALDQDLGDAVGKSVLWRRG